ncbi:hypothetical protein AK965_16125 [Vibrio sp. PID17_43]|nr:hypothetical protein AK965_16125 [Vibrio sp. PID17_43]
MLTNFGAILSYDTNKIDTNKIELVQCEVFSGYLHVFFVFLILKLANPTAEAIVNWTNQLFNLCKWHHI